MKRIRPLALLSALEQTTFPEKNLGHSVCKIVVGSIYVAISLLFDLFNLHHL